MNLNQANKSFDKLEAMVKQLLNQMPFDFIEKMSEEANLLKEGMEEQIDKLENKKTLNEDQENTLDRFQSSVDGISNIAETIESMKDAVEEFRDILKQIEEVKTTM